MLDSILGRPSQTVRRTQVFLVVFFWVWRLYKGDGSAMGRATQTGRHRAVTSARVASHQRSLRTVAQNKTWWRRIWTTLVGRTRGMPWMTNVNERLKYFTPYQIILATFTFIYALRHFDDILGLGAPDPLANMYSRSYYRATYINTAFDAGFSTAMTIRPKWLKDLSSVVFTFYYLIFASQGDEVLRRFRAVCSVEMLRTTWEKTNNPYLRAITYFGRVKLPVVRHITVPRVKESSRSHLPPIKAMLFFAGTEKELEKATELIIDFPGGGFIAMGPECHEERLRTWAKRTGKPVLSIDYGKAPEYPYPWAIEEGFDAYRVIMETKGAILGIKSGRLSTVLTGDSAGGNICTTIMNRIIEHHSGKIPKPAAIILAYPALDFNYTSWMTPANLRVLRTEQSETHIPGLLDGKDHLSHKSPLVVVKDVEKKSKRPPARSRKSWAESIGGKFGMTMTSMDRSARSVSPHRSKSVPGSPVNSFGRGSSRKSGFFALKDEHAADSSSAGEEVSDASETDDEVPNGAPDHRREADKSLRERIKTPGVLSEDKFARQGGILAASPLEDVPAEEVIDAAKAHSKKSPIGTRLTMTSRVGYFQDRTISPSMMRAMAIMYVGPRRSPDFTTDYYISPILTPPHLLEHFPPVYIICGERDPFVDDTVIFAGKLREAKRARRARASNQPTKGDEMPDHILRETDDDWVQMRIIEGWGHGFMQMTALMREVESVLVEMADWIDESFERGVLLQQDIEEIAAAHAAARAAFAPDAPVLLSPTDTKPSPLRSRHVKPVRDYKKNPPNKTLGDADLGSGLGNIDTDDEGIIAFTPKSKKRTPPPSQFAPVPRRSSKESLNRSNSIPRFDADDSHSSGDTMSIDTPTNSVMYSPVESKGTGAFAFFSRPSAAAPKPLKAGPSKSAATALYSGSGPAFRRGSMQNPSLAAAVASAARAASPALAAAGLVPERVVSLDNDELMRRRRAEAVLGLGQVDSGENSADEK
ncbi:Hormone-sensitive lipase [Vanrija pseudolonga]|uniref:Hormone-sensitive lipase n=1 Tax=Vanrija pseudolonga TaxID=143232 RepID=A0AAF0Y812_9TREE|nr:Hormone-sensitive lipase [Vanrija pseudolonga]